MQVKITPLQVKGRQLKQAELRAAPPFMGKLKVAEARDYDLSRQVVRARLLDLTAGTETDILPELCDVRLLWADDKKMRFSGFEQVDNVNYGQTWMVEVA